MQEIKALEAKRAALQAAYHETPTPELDAAHRAARAELQAALTAGCKPCPDCEAPPHGILQPSRDPRAPAMVEIGCLACRDHRALGFSQELARDQWNAEDYIPPKAEPGPSATLAKAEG